MRQINTLLISLFILALASTSFGQEVAPLKTFDFSISINKLKTQEQADLIKSEISLIPGVKNCALILTDYELTFSTTNHDMSRYQIMDRIKAILIENGSEIVTINREEK